MLTMAGRRHIIAHSMSIAEWLGDEGMTVCLLIGEVNMSIEKVPIRNVVR